jgi:quercetin dioxygenase-like cupin family protein
MRKRMSWLELAGLVVALVGAPAAAAAQTKDLDAAKADAAHHKIELENDRVRVVRYVIPPHEKTALHEHPSLVNVLLTDAEARSTTPDGKTSEVHGKAGTAAWRGPSAHVYENVSDKPIEGILVEPKGKGDPGWKPPARDDLKVDPAHHKVEFENDQVRVERYWYERGEKGPMHDHAANVQIALTDANPRITSGDGKVTEAHLKRGEVRFRDALSHAVENAGDRFEGILVVLKSAPPGKAGAK